MTALTNYPQPGSMQDAVAIPMPPLPPTPQVMNSRGNCLALDRRMNNDIDEFCSLEGISNDCMRSCTFIAVTAISLRGCVVLGPPPLQALACLISSKICCRIIGRNLPS